MLRPATPLTILYFIAFVLLVLATISTPIVKGIHLASFNHVDFGVFGYCTPSKCSNIDIGYSVGTFDPFEHWEGDRKRRLQTSVELRERRPATRLQSCGNRGTRLTTTTTSRFENTLWRCRRQQRLLPTLFDPIVPLLYPYRSPGGSSPDPHLLHSGSRRSPPCAFALSSISTGHSHPVDTYSSHYTPRLPR